MAALEIGLRWIDFEADVYHVRKAVELVLHGPDLYDPHGPHDKRYKGRKPNFDVVMGKSPAGRIHNGTAILRVLTDVGSRFLKWGRESDKNNIVVNRRALKVYSVHRNVPPGVIETLEKGLYIDPEQDKRRTQIEEQARLVRLRIAQVQFGVWYKPSNTHASQGRTFSVEYEREFLCQSAAYISVMYDHKLIHIDIGQRETEETNYLILVKFSSIRKLGLGYDSDEFGQPLASIIFDLLIPPNFEQESYNNRAPEGIKRKGKYKTRDRISALDEAHALVAPYAHHLRIVLANPEDLVEFEKICLLIQCEPRPIRVPRVDAVPMQFFSQLNLDHVQRWTETMDWKVAFQIEAYLRCGLLNTHDLFFTLRTPIEQVFHDYGAEASEVLRWFSVTLKERKVDESLSDCLSRALEEHRRAKQRRTAKPLQLTQDHIPCHHVIVTPSRMLLEGPYPTQSNRVIRRYLEHDPTFADRFIRVEFRDEDHLAYRWDGDVDGTWFLQQRVGGILRRGFKLGGRAFEYLAYSMSALREHSVWFVSPFRDPEEGYVTAEKSRSSLGDFSELRRTPSKYAARIAQAFTATGRGGKIQRGEWEEQPELGPHTDGVGTISPELACKIWEEKCRTTHSLSPGRREPPSAYQFRFLGYKGVVVVDYRLEGIKMRLRGSQRKFPVDNVEEAEFEIARSFDYPNPVHLNRPAVMALENRGVKIQAFLDLQGKEIASIHFSSDSLELFRKQLKKYRLGGKFHLEFILEQLNKLGLDFKDNVDKKAIRSAFFERLARYAMNHSLREVKYKARIPLVGVADEGRAYINEGAKEDDVFTLKEGFIYVCVQEPGGQPEYFKGTCLISRSPVIHPGDVQRVYAVGEPPQDKLCFFRGLKNVVVLPAVGDRSLASCLAGGDLDGDAYDIYYKNPGLLPTVQAEPANHPPGEVWTLEEGRGDATVEDICDFIVEYINSDVMGLLADRHIVIADQSKEGVFDERCMKLAALCSKAVDYVKNGKPVDIHNNLPKPILKFKPDWHKAEVTGARELDYYESDRALGYLYRNISLEDPDKPTEGFTSARSHLLEAPGVTSVTSITSVTSARQPSHARPPRNSAIASSYARCPT